MSLASGLRTIIVDRQPPYQVTQAWHRTMRTIGLPETTMRASGFQFRVRRLTCDVNFVDNVVLGREYFPSEITIGPTDTIVDIGGNIGTFAVLAASMVPKGRVVTVEPDADNLRLLRQNLALNGASAFVYPYAVASQAGPIAFSAAAEGGYHTILPERFDTAPVRHVEAKTLADVFAAAKVQRCQLLKLDCEGAEYDILPKIPADIASRIDQIAMEYHRVPEADRRLRESLDGLGPKFTIIRHEPFDGGGGHMWLRQNR
jgi:FkbM family methyltransferase